MKMRIFLLCLLAFVFTGCSRQENQKITFSEGHAVSDSKNVIIDGSTVTITGAGSYDISGKCEEGQLIVNVTNGKAVYLNLDGLELRCTEDSPIIIRQSSMTVFNIVSGSQNIITDEHPYTDLVDQENTAENLLEDTPNAAIYSKAPLLFKGNGDGKLVINAKSHNGISSSDTLTVEGGNITVNATHHGLKGKDYVVISGSNLTIKSGNDGIKATNTEDTALGYINITGGNITVNADDDGIYAPQSISVTGGNLVVKSHNKALKTEGAIELNAGIVDITTKDDVFACKTKTIGKGMILTVNGTAYEE